MSGGAFGGMNPKQLAMMMRDPSNIEKMLRDDVAGVGASPAAILADTINVMRLDNFRLAQALDVDGVGADRMTEDRAAQLVAGVVRGDGWQLVEVFNQVAETRDTILRDVLDDAEYQAFMDAKTGSMLTDDPDTFDGSGDDGGE